MQEDDAPKTVLITDDSRDEADLLAVALRRYGHNVILANSAAEALAILETQTVDLLVTDVFMPKMNGLALLEQVKAKHPALPVILITNYDKALSDAEAISKGAVGIIEKMKGNYAICERIAQVIGKPRLRTYAQFK